jgi:hypothetical protein
VHGIQVDVADRLSVVSQHPQLGIDGEHDDLFPA